MVKKVLQLLINGEAVNTAQISAILGASEAAVEAAMAELQADKLLLGWRPILHPKVQGGDRVQALIEVKVMPEREGGFNKVAERIARFGQVETCYLMSGGYDLMVVVKGPNLLEIATFVAEKLSTIDRVQSTATRFMLRCYKESGFLIETQPDELDRPAVSP